MQDKLKKIKDEASSAILNAQDADALEAIRNQFLGRKGALTALIKQIGSLSPEEKPLAGQRINEIKQALQASLDERAGQLQSTGSWS